MTEIDLSLYSSLVEAEARADQARKLHEAEAAKFTRARDEIREQLALLMGDATVGLVNGHQVLKRTPSRQFAWARFRSENPDMWEEYKVPKLTYEVDTDKLSAEQPDVYNRYSGTRWTNSSTELG